MRYNCQVDICRMRAEGLDTKSSIKLDGFSSQIEASCFLASLKSCDTTNKTMKYFMLLK